MADRKISELTALKGALNVADALPIADDSASQTKKINPKDLLEQGFLLIDDGSIPQSKLDTAVSLPPGSIGTDELATDSVTDEKLADESTFILSDTEPKAEYVGQGWLDTTNNKTYIWNGTTWVEHKAAGSINAVTYANSDPAVIASGVQTGDSLALDVELADTTAARQFLAGPSSVAGDVTARQIIGTDLPEATATERGAVSIPADGGLSVTSGAVSIDNSVTPNSTDSVHLTVYDSHGLVTGGRGIASGDLPHAEVGAPGAVSPGSGLAVSADGELNHVNNISPGQGTKVSWDAQGHVTGGNPLLPEDLPAIPGPNVGPGIDGTNIDDRSLKEVKLADYSTCYVQEGQPAENPKLGQFWFTPSTNQLRVYGRGSGGDIWLAVGFGALQANNLRWLGTIDAAASTMVALTSIGVAEGLRAGDPIPPPSDALSGGYFITVEAGSNINQPNVSTDEFTEGDWMLCIDAAQGYVHIDAGVGGGGGGVDTLGELLDVSLDGTEGPFKSSNLDGAYPAVALADRQYLMYESKSGMWVNSDVIDGGTY